MTGSARDAVLVSSLLLPAKTATMACAPGASKGARVTVPLAESVPLPRLTGLPLNVSVKLTVPTGVMAPCVAVTVAVSATLLPAMPGLGAATRAVAVVAGFTICRMLAEVAWA